MNILVTGTSKGIGQKIAQKFLLEGHVVYGLDILDSSIKDDNYHHYKVDVRDKNLPDIDNINILINNAGVQDEDSAIEVNLLGAINVSEKYAFASSMESILFICSAAARNGAEFPLYCASKGGLVTYMKNLALKVARAGVTCNSISPGGVNTSLNEHILNSEELYEKVLNENLFHRWAEPEEIADWAYFLTVINKSMTGEDLLIDNGEMLKSNFIW